MRGAVGEVGVALAEGEEVPRILGRVRGRSSGPTLICVTAMHGNEPAGVRAVDRVLEVLERDPGRISGEFVALVGNRSALASGRRYLDRDLNRAWTPERVRALRESSRPDADPLEARVEVEDIEQAGLLAALDGVIADARGPVHILDLHTTSGPGGLFTTVSDTLPNRAFAQRLPVPLILGLEELVDGTLLEYFNRSGYITAVFEAGQHTDPESADRAEAAVWLAIGAAGLIPEPVLPERTRGWKRLARDSAGLPRVLEMRFRHPVQSGDDFVMRPGFTSFERVQKGEVLAHDRRGPILAPETARILMPLYQTQGQDGFFIVREFRPFWLHLSRLLRTLRADRIAHWFPGVRRLEGRPDALIVDRGVARFFALEFLHLLGFRKQREMGRALVLLRQRPTREEAEQRTSPDSEGEDR